MVSNRNDGSPSRVFAWHVGDCGSILGCDRPNSLKQVVTAPVTTARQQLGVSVTNPQR